MFPCLCIVCLEFIPLCPCVFLCLSLSLSLSLYAASCCNSFFFLFLCAFSLEQRVVHLQVTFMDVVQPAIAQLVEHLTVECCSNQMVPGSIPGGRIYRTLAYRANQCAPLPTSLHITSNRVVFVDAGYKRAGQFYQWVMWMLRWQCQPCVPYLSRCRSIARNNIWETKFKYHLHTLQPFRKPCGIQNTTFVCRSSRKKTPLSGMGNPLHQHEIQKQKQNHQSMFH